MIRHQVYFDTLGSMREDSASWRSVFAGLSVLRLVDSHADDPSAAAGPSWAQVHSVRTAIENVSEGDPVRGVLMAVVDEIIDRKSVDAAVCRALIAYGKSLDYEASWGLATDVFTTVAKLARPEKNPALAVEANVAVGGAARRNGDWEVSARAYSQAAYIADTLGDKQGVLTVQVGIANTYMAKGNLPQAEAILDDVIVQSRDELLPATQAMALHSRAVIAQKRGKFTDGLKLAYDAFALTTREAERDLVLADIGAIFTDLGMRESARDTHLVLAATAQTQLVRWTATINLMELASLDGDEKAFDGYARELMLTKCGPWVRSNFMLIFGEGLGRLDRSQQAIEVLDEAAAYATDNQLHEIAFRAQAALSEVRSAVRKSTPASSPNWVPDDVASVVRAMSALRKSALPALSS